MKMGKAGYGKTEFKKKNQFKFGEKCDKIIARIFGPMGKLSDNPKRWSRYHSVQFGYKNSEGKHRPFESPLKEKDDVITVRDYAQERLEDLQAKLKKATDEGNEPLMLKLKGLVGFMGVYNNSRSYFMNAMLLDGSIGSLELKHKAKKKLDLEIERLTKENVDPLSEDNGRYFVFTRTGKGNDTDFDVKVYQTKVEAVVNGKTKMVDEDVISVLGSDVLSRLDSEAFELEDMYPRVTEEEVKQIVEESELLTGKSPACDRIFDARWKATRDAKKSKAAQQEEPVPYGEDEQEKPPTQTKAREATKAAPASNLAASTTQTASKSQSAPIEELSDEDFFKQIDQPLQ